MVVQEGKLTNIFESKFDSESNCVVIHFLTKVREEHCDVLLCTYTERGVNVKIAFQASILTLHSIVFQNMFSYWSIFEDVQQNAKMKEIKMSEPVNVVTSFLAIMDGEKSKRLEEGFDHWIQVIEMGEKYDAKIVMKSGIHYLCQAFNAIINCKTDRLPDSQFTHSTILKLICIYNRIKKGQIQSTQTEMEEIQNTIQKGWIPFCEICGVQLKAKLVLGKNTVERSYEVSPCQLGNFIQEENVSYFSSKEIMAFENVLKEFMVVEKDILVLLNKHFIGKV